MSNPPAVVKIICSPAMFVNPRRNIRKPEAAMSNGFLLLCFFLKEYHNEIKAIEKLVRRKASSINVWSRLEDEEITPYAMAKGRREQ